MRRFTLLCALMVFIAIPTQATQSEQGWINVDNPEELRRLISGRKMQAGEYWSYFFRADGKMAYSQDGYDSISVREWTINEKGELCLSVFKQPNRIIDCPTIQRTNTSPFSYRIRGVTGNQSIQFVDPTKDLIDAIEKTVGAE